MAIHKSIIPRLSKNALTVLKRRYLQRNEEGHVMETAKDMFQRVAKTLANADSKFTKNADLASLSEQFYNMMAELEFIPNSPTL
ncbi:MAG: ribonucleotide reductase N-terminal alpha domain-containing protein, partial [Syntrophales bacterium]